MRERNFAWSRVASASYQRDGTRCVMRRADLPLSKFIHFELAHQRQNRRTFGRLGFRHWRQDTRQTLREHTFAGAGWPHQQQAVLSRRCNFQRAFGLCLTFHIDQIKVVFNLVSLLDHGCFQRVFACDKRGDFEQRFCAQYVAAFDARGLNGGRLRQHQRVAGFRRSHRHRERATHGP